MSSEIQVLPAEIEVLGRGWPEQRIESYDVLFTAFRSQYAGTLSVGTERHYSDAGKRWCRHANGKSLTPKLMFEWHLWVCSWPSLSASKRAAAQRVNRMHTVIRKFLGWLKAMGFITHDPSMALPRLRERSSPPARLWLHSEYVQIIQHCSVIPTLERFAWLVVLGYHTGMSLIDCCHLTWDEVVLSDSGPSYIQKTRAKLERAHGRRAIFTVPIIPGGELWEWLKKLEARKHVNYERSHGLPYVHRDLPALYDPLMPMLSRTLLRRVFRAALGADVVAGRTFRHLRNSFCSRLINSGADSLLVSKMTGHLDIRQLSQYVLPNLRAMQEAVQNALRWVEGEMSPGLPQRFLPPCPAQSDSRPCSLALEERGAGGN